MQKASVWFYVLGVVLTCFFAPASSELLVLISVLVALFALIAFHKTAVDPGDIVVIAVVPGMAAALVGFIMAIVFDVSIGADTKLTPLTEQIRQADQAWHLRVEKKRGNETYTFTTDKGHLRKVVMTYFVDNFNQVRSVKVYNQNGHAATWRTRWGRRALFEALSSRVESGNAYSSTPQSKRVDFITPPEPTPEVDQPYWKLPL